MARERDYAAEYQSRNAKALAEFGITYSQLRKVRGMSKGTGMAGFLSQLADFKRGLDIAIVRISSGMPDVWQEIAEEMYRQSYALAPGRTKHGLAPRWAPNTAILDIGGEEPPRSRAVFFGAIRRFGWYADPQFDGSVGRQFPPYVGSQWVPGSGVAGMPHFIGPGLNRAADYAYDRLGDAIEDACIAAFPIGT